MFYFLFYLQCYSIDETHFTDLLSIVFNINKSFLIKHLSADKKKAFDTSFDN